MADGPQLVTRIEADGGPLGWIVVDSTVRGRSRGGLRLQPDVDEAEVRALARAMTLKYGFLGLPQGGAKAGVVGDPEAPPQERRARLAAFADRAASLLRSRQYQPDSDMGTTNDDVRFLLRRAGVHVKRREHRGTLSGHWTAVSVLGGLEAGLRARGIALAGARVAIEGFGAVGGALAGLVAAAGGRVIAVSTSRGALHDPAGLDVPRLVALAAERGSRLVEDHPAERIALPELLELPADALCPCARHDTIAADNASRVTARVVAPGANAPVTAEAAEILHRRGVLVLPDFVTNCGGVLGGTMEFAAVPGPRIERFVRRRVEQWTAELTATAAERGVPPRAVAEAIALRRFAALQDASRRTPPALALEAGLELHRRGWVPRRLVGALSSVWFERALMRDSGA